MKKLTEKQALLELNKIKEELKLEVVKQMQKTNTEVKDICYNMQLTEEQFVEQLINVGDIGFCADATKLLIKKNNQGE